MIAGEDADAAAERLEHAAAAATKYKDELADARRDAREAIAEARDAKDLIEQARQQIADARQRLADARSGDDHRRERHDRERILRRAPRGRAGRPSTRRAGAADAAEDGDRARPSAPLERAEEDLERAQQRGRRADRSAPRTRRTMLRGRLDGGLAGGDGTRRGRPGHRSRAPPARASTGLSPEQVATFFSRVGPEGGARLAQTHPELVGPLDGAPLDLRYAANTALAEREVQRLEGELAGVESALEEEGDGRRPRLPAAGRRRCRSSPGARSWTG